MEVEVSTAAFLGYVHDSVREVVVNNSTEASGDRPTLTLGDGTEQRKHKDQ